MITVSLSGVRKFYGAHAVLDGLSWDISEGEVIGLVGPNGSGKTTLLRCIAGLDEIDEGTLHRRRGPTTAYCRRNPTSTPRSRPWRPCSLRTIDCTPSSASCATSRRRWARPRSTKTTSGWRG